MADEEDLGRFVRCECADCGEYCLSIPGCKTPRCERCMKAHCGVQSWMRSGRPNYLHPAADPGYPDDGYPDWRP